MVDIDFIKWMCEKTEGFKFEQGDFIDDCYIRTPAGMEIDLIDFDNDLWKKDYSPHLLQRAIESVNRTGNHFIIHDWNEITVESKRYQEGIQQYIFKDKPDQAKESALKYIYEQEKKL